MTWKTCDLIRSQHKVGTKEDMTSVKMKPSIFWNNNKDALRLSQELASPTHLRLKGTETVNSLGRVLLKGECIWGILLTEGSLGSCSPWIHLVFLAQIVLRPIQPKSKGKVQMPATGIQHAGITGSWSLRPHCQGKPGKWRNVCQGQSSWIGNV